MSKLTSSESFVRQFKQELSNAKNSVTIISPYITDAAVNEIVPLVKDKQLKSTVITIPVGKEYVTGAVEPMALLHLKTAGFGIYKLARLHAKLYIIDDRLAFVGSANFTLSGWRIHNSGNHEVMTKLILTPKDVQWIHTQFIKPSRPLLVSKKWVDELHIQIDKFKESYTNLLADIEVTVGENSEEDTLDSPYHHFLRRLQENKKISSFEHIRKGYGQNAFKIDEKYTVKILRSKTHEGTSKFDDNYRFALSKNATDQALENKVNAFVMLLEETGDFAWLPRTFLEESMFIQKLLDGGKNAWQVQISRQDTSFYIRSKGRNAKVVYDITNYINTIRYRKSVDIKKVKPSSLKRENHGR